jgi:hypothetical protein
VIGVQIWYEDVWGVGTEEVGVPAADYREEVGDVAGPEREATFDLRDRGMDAEVAVRIMGVHEFVGEGEAGYADCCDAGKGDEVSLGLGDWGEGYTYQIPMHKIKSTTSFFLGFILRS